MLVNLMVTALSHIAVGFSRVASHGGRVGAPLNTARRGSVDVCASRILSTRSVLTHCDSSASLIQLVITGDKLVGCMGGFKLVPYAKLRGRAHDLGQPPGIGTSGGSRPAPLIASRIDLPDVCVEFDPGPFVSTLSMPRTLEPDTHLKADEDLEAELPKGRLASKEKLLLLGKRWDTIGTSKAFKMVGE